MRRTLKAASLSFALLAALPPPCVREPPPPTQRHVRANRFDDSGCFVTDDRWKLRDRQCSAAIVDVYKIETDDGVSHQNLVTDGVRDLQGLESEDIGLSILVDTCSCCFGRHIAPSRRVCVSRCCRRTGDNTGQ